jgi:hypothetical protein
MSDRERGQAEGRRKEETEDQTTEEVETETDLDALDDFQKGGQ